MILYSFVACIIVALCEIGQSEAAGRRARKCCSPDQWETEVLGTGASFKGGLDRLTWKIKLSYDYTNLRWAYDQKNPNNESDNIRLVFDHKQKKKYYITTTECHSAPLNVQMFRYCVPENATYHGYFEQGQNLRLGYDVWSWDFTLFPLRNVMRVSRKQCLPLQESVFGLVQNSYQWEEGELACIPWKNPQRMAAGMCYKCTAPRKISRRGAQLTSIKANMLFNDMKLEIKDQEIFSTPRKCHQTDQWNTSLKLDNLLYHLIIRFKWDHEFTAWYANLMKNS